MLEPGSVYLNNNLSLILVLIFHQVTSLLASESIVHNFKNFKLCKIPVKVQDEIEATIVLYGEFEKTERSN